MSTKSVKQDRLAASEAKRDRKLREAEAAQKAQAKARAGWIAGIVVAVLAILFVILVNTGLLFRSTTALKVNGKSYSPAEVSYFYGSEYQSFLNTYGNYASYFGLDTSGGITGLKGQAYPTDEFADWRSYFLNSAKENIRSFQALADYANANGVTLSDDEVSEIDSALATLEQNVISGGWKNLDSYLSSNFGKGVNKKIARDCELFKSLATKAYTHGSEQFEYSDEELSEYYDSLNGESDKYNYWYYYLAADKVDSEPDADGNVSSDVTSETMEEAQKKANNMVNAYNARIPEEGFGAADNLEGYLNSAISSQVSTATCTTMKNTFASNINSDVKDWVTAGERALGDISIIENSSETGYYIVVFGSHDDNHYPTLSVRHILIKAAEDEDGSYTDEALEEAKAKAEEIYEEWKNGEATEESFAALAEQYSEDEGSNTNGGLYENIYKGQMVDTFDEFCFAGHTHGDTGIVTANSGSYAGAHIIYYVGEGELYSNYIARTEKLSDDTSAWYDSILEGYEMTNGPALNLAA